MEYSFLSDMHNVLVNFPSPHPTIFLAYIRHI